MSSLAVSDVPYTERKAYRPLITQGRCKCCTNPDREGLEHALIEGKLSYKEIGETWHVSITSVFNHKMKHISKMLDRAADEYGIVEPKKILARIQQRSTVAHDRYMADPEKLGHGKLAAEHDTILIKATGNWHESRDITLGGSIQLTAADKADADYLVFMRDCHPEQIGEYEQWAERRLMAEVQPMLTAERIEQGSVEHDDACKDGDA